uniref:Sodium/calcium exchanger membrane region domain-containing protein n=1 Tax=Acrobeloides nanus TaxID=290746 RepID=A0A914E5D3_9BILA
MISSSIRWLLAQQPSNSTLNSTLATNNADDGAEECSPFKLYGHYAHSLACQYVKNNSDTCEGGGYLTWTRYTICEENDVAKTFIIIASVILLLILFLFLSISADDFFCRNISAIVDHLKIPQHIAGVTFMAFGNGAPDVFTSLASALSTNQPKAGLSIGELLGAGIFVTTLVVATIIIAKPFKVMRRPILRDIIFYLIAIGWICFILFYDTQVYIWQPAFLLVLYAIYVCTVIFGRQISQSRKKKERQIRKIERALTLLDHNLTVVDKLDELKAEELHALEQKASAMNSMLSIPNGNTRLSIPNGNNSVPNGNMRLSIPSGNHNLLGVSTVEQTIVNGWMEKPVHPDEISYDMDDEHKDHNQKKISLIRSKSDIIA